MSTHRPILRAPRRLAWKRPAAALAALIATALMCACGVEYDLVIKDDDTVDLTYTIWDSSGLGSITEATCNEDLIPSGSGPFPSGTEVVYTYTTHGKDPACEASGRAIPLSELDDKGADWSVTHEGREYVFSMSPSALVGSNEQALAAQAAGLTARVSVTFPAEVTSANGKIDGRTVTWSDLTSDSGTLRARGGDGSSALLLYGLIGAGAVVLLIAAALVIRLVVTRRRRRSGPALPTGPALDPQAHDPGIGAHQSYPPSAPGQGHPAQFGQTPATAPLHCAPTAPLQPPGQGAPPHAPSGAPAPATPSWAPDPAGTQAPQEPYPQSPTPGHPPMTDPYQPTRQVPLAGGQYDAAQEAALPTQRMPLTGQGQAPGPVQGPHHPQPYQPPGTPGQHQQHQ